jgi:hypothetical protein
LDPVRFAFTMATPGRQQKRKNTLHPMIKV